jgi:nitrite reductase (NO-forming)
MLPAGVVVMLFGLWGGLARLGYSLPADTSSDASHGILMSLGFLGTLIAVERAVALRAAWAWLAPAAAAVGSFALVLDAPAVLGKGLLLLGGAVLTVVYVALDRVQRSTHNTLMGVAALSWVVAAALWLANRDIALLVPWLAGFLVITIVAERLELSRLLQMSQRARQVLVAVVAVFFVGAIVSTVNDDVGLRIGGGAFVALAGWLLVCDLARRTVLQRGVTRFMAVGLLAGYGWLAVGGLLWLGYGFHVDDAVYDAQLHAVFLGFVMSMVFAHAPVIAPSVLRRPFQYRPVLYVPLALLHLSLLVRLIGGDAFSSDDAWRAGGITNEIALLLFVAGTAASLLFVRARSVASSGQDAHTAREHGPWRSRLTSPLAAGALIGVVVLVASIAFANSGSSSTNSNSSTTDKGGVSADGSTTGVAISLVEMRIEPSTVTVKLGTHLVLRVTNNGTMRHDLRLSNGAHTPLLKPGQTAVLDAGVITKALDGWCTVPGHRAAGMTMRVALGAPASTVRPATPPTSTGAAGMPGMPGMQGMADMPGMTGDASSGPDAMSPNLAGAPPDGWKPFDASLPAVEPGSVHDVTWHIKDVTMPVAPGGVTQTMWTFNGTVPGPVLHGRVGDTFNVTVVNDTQMTHNIDFHAEEGPPAAVMTPIAPGASHSYHFVAKYAGAWLYHCAVEPMLMHMGNGMYGALIIDPPGLAPVAAQYVLVGSELFFGPQGGVGDYAKMLADKPDAVVFNGFPFAYQHAPLRAHSGDRVRVWVVDAGPTRALAFHVVGAPFETTYVNGAYLLQAGGAAKGGAQTLAVDPGDGGFVELTFTQPGSYPFLTHAMADAVIGAAGSFAVSN